MRRINPNNKQLFLDQKSRTAYASDPSNTDVIVTADSENATLANHDDVLASTLTNPFLLAANQLEGKDSAIINDARLHGKNVRGNITLLQTTRQKFVHVDNLTGARGEGA